MNRDELRKVEYKFSKTVYGHDEELGHKIGRQVEQKATGCFHTWKKVVSEEDRNETVYGLIEQEDGQMTEILDYKIKFIS